MAIEIHVPSRPKRLKLTLTMIEDFMIDPVMAAWVLMRVKFDAFQASALRTMWFTPDVIDTSGFGTGKSLRDFVFANLRCMILGDQKVWIYYQTFEAGKNIFWTKFKDYNERTAPLFHAQLGKLDASGDEDGKDNTKGPACYLQHYQDGGLMAMPAPGWFQSATSQAGLTFNVALVDEWTKVETMRPAGQKFQLAGGELAGGIDSQILGRVRGASFNQFHPIWGNHRVFSATAESPSHPAARRMQTFRREIARGNPTYAIIHYCFKHFSNLKSHTGKPFKDQVPDWKTISNMKAQLASAHYQREVLGIWARETAGWYSESALNQCVQNGIAAGTEPETTRNALLEGARYFEGVDPAPSASKRADDGAMAVIRARPKPGLGHPPTSNVSDWITEAVWAYRIRGERRRAAIETDDGVFMARTASAWAGLIQLKHQHFGFDGILMDKANAGAFIVPELQKTRVPILGVETEVTPITTLEEQMGFALSILSLFMQKDSGVAAIFPLLRGDDMLIDAAHMALQQAIEHGLILFPKSFNERPTSETKTWSKEKQWALKNLDATRKQLENIEVATREETGTWLLTGNNAKQYSAKGKKDLAYALLFAYVRFLIWLKMNELDFGNPQEGGFVVSTF